MERSPRFPSREHFDIIRSALLELSSQGVPSDIRNQAMNAVAALVPDAEIDSDMIDTLVRYVQSDLAKRRQSSPE